MAELLLAEGRFTCARAWYVERDVHVWLATLDPASAGVEDALRLLSAEERVRHARLRDPADAASFALAHGALRAVVCEYAGVDAAAIRFERGKYGKPWLASPAGSGIRFSFSRSHRCALIAVAFRRDVGVDVEELRDMDDLDGAARVCFSARECSLLASLPAADRRDFFFRVWTRREAVLKAAGTGFAVDPAALDADPVRRAVSFRGVWSLPHLPPLPGYAAALAVGDDGDGPRDAIVM